MANKSSKFTKSVSSVLYTVLAFRLSSINKLKVLFIFLDTTEVPVVTHKFVSYLFDKGKLVSMSILKG